MEEIKYTVKDKNGIHARPAGLIVQTSKQFKSDIRLKCGVHEADCKKLFQIMQLGVKYGDEITLTADGGDEGAALDEINRTMSRAGL